jgi:outer membrane receptor protein involved in Fe transport
MGTPGFRRVDTAGNTSRFFTGCILILALAAPAPGAADDVTGGETALPANSAAPDAGSDASDDAAAVDPAEPPVRRVGGVTVTATRGERDVLEVPGNVTVIEREQIDESGVRTVPELLRRQSGLFVTSTTTNPAGVQVEARGFNNGGSLGSSLLVQVDGRRVNEADTGNTDWALIPLDEIESIEIVRGPASAVYGDNAVGGVINIRTRPMEGPLRATLRGRLGRYDSGGGSLNAAGTVGPITGSLFVEGFETDGYRHRSDFDRFNVKGVLQANLADRFLVGVRGGHYLDHRSFPGALSSDEMQMFGRRASDPDSADDSSRVDNDFVEGWVEGLLAEDVELRVRPFYRWRDDDTTITSLAWGTTGIDTHKRSGGVDFQIQVDVPLFGMRSRLIVGGDFLYEETDRVIAFPSGVQISDSDRTVGAAFAQEELNLTEALLLTAGVRFDHASLNLKISDPDLDPAIASADDDPRFNVASPRVALTYRIRPDLASYVSYSRGFRLPNFDEDAPLLSFPPGGPPTIPDLDRQISDAVEVGAKLRGERVDASLATYWMSVKNEITYNPFTFANENFDRVRHVGVETALAVQILSWLEAHANYTFEHVEIREADDPALEGRRMPMNPRHRGTLGILATIPFDLELGADGNIVGSRVFANDFDRELPKLNVYGTLDLHMAWRPSFGEHLSGALSLDLRNVTNEKYSGFAARYDVYDPFPNTVPTRFFNPAARRTWEVGMMLTVRQ